MNRTIIFAFLALWSSLLATMSTAMEIISIEEQRISLALKPHVENCQGFLEVAALPEILKIICGNLDEEGKVTLAGLSRANHERIGQRLSLAIWADRIDHVFLEDSPLGTRFKRLLDCTTRIDDLHKMASRQDIQREARGVLKRSKENSCIVLYQFREQNPDLVAQRDVYRDYVFLCETYDVDHDENICRERLALLADDLFYTFENCLSCMGICALEAGACCESCACLGNCAVGCGKCCCYVGAKIVLPVGVGFCLIGCLPIYAPFLACYACYEIAQ